MRLPRVIGRAKPCVHGEPILSVCCCFHITFVYKLNSSCIHNVHSAVGGSSCAKFTLAILTPPCCVNACLHKKNIRERNFFYVSSDFPDFMRQAACGRGGDKRNSGCGDRLCRGASGALLCQVAVRLRRRRDAYARGEDDFFFLHAVLGCNGFQKLSFPCVKTMLFRLLFVLHILNLLGCIDSILVAAIFVYKKSSACETSSLRHQAFQTLRAAK